MLFYSRSARDLALSGGGLGDEGVSEVVLDLPGGGFISMGPEHHEERLRCADHLSLWELFGLSDDFYCE